MSNLVFFRKCEVRIPVKVINMLCKLVQLNWSERRRTDYSNNLENKGSDDNYIFRTELRKIRKLFILFHCLARDVYVTT